MRKIVSFLFMTALLAVSVLPTYAEGGTTHGLNPGARASDGIVQGDEAADGRYLIEFHQYGPQAAATIRAAGGQVIHEFPAYAVVAARLPAQALQGLQNNPAVKFIEADPRRYPMTHGDIATDGTEIQPYGIAMVQADQVDDMHAGNRKVCIIDSGYYMGHEDLQDTNVTASPDSGTGDPFTDGSGHGTHVAGTIVGLDNTAGVVGVLPSGNVHLHIVKVFGDDGLWAYSSDLASALGKCREVNANVVNMSLGGGRASRLEQRAFDDAYATGVLSVAAAGNDGSTTKSYPASYSSVISVAAIDHNKVVADFSQKNDAVELAAPGVDVLSSVPYDENNTLTVDGVTFNGNHIEYAARTPDGGTSGTLVNGGLCDATGGWSGQVVLCERGSISFYDKVMNVQNSGGVAAVIYNNVSGGFYGTLGDGNSSTIPAISLSQEDGQYLVTNKLGASGNVVSQVQEPASDYAHFNGTSMATPHVAGVAALVWSYNTTWTNEQIRTALHASAEDLGDVGKDNSYGYGLVQAHAALNYLGGGSGGGGDTGGGDTTAPDISGVASRVTHKNGSFEITWTTDEASNSEVTFTGGTSGTYTNSDMVTSHRMTFRGSKGVLYTYTVSSTDAAGNKATSGPYMHQN